MTKSPGQVPKEHPSHADTRPPYVAALAAGTFVFALYALTLAPTTAFWDTSEYIATAHIMGIPHPPGNPLFVVLARAWELLLAPLGLSVAVRINLFSAFMSAAAHGLWFLVVHHVLRVFSPDRRFRLIGAFVAVLVSATAFTVWNQSNVNEKVYTVSLLTIALLSWLAFRWQENLGKGKDDNLLVLMAFILALSVGNHLMAFLAAPAIAVFILAVHPRTLLNWRLYPTVLAVGLLGLSIHLVLPIRAGLDPIINEAAPTCPDIGEAITAIATYGNTGCQALSEALTRRQYDKPPLLPRLAALHSQYVNYLQYFDWQWARGVDVAQTLFANFRLPFTMLFTGLGVWGALEHQRRDRPSFLYVLTLFATLSVGLVFYLNFRYGYSIPTPGLELANHEVRERDYFFIVSFSVWGLWAGLGIAALWDSLGERLGSLKKASPVLLLAVLPLVFNWSIASRTGDYSARDWAYNLLMSVEPYGILFTNGDNDTFPLWYLQEVEGIRQDVTVIVTSYLNTDWYARQLKELTAPCQPGESPDDDPTRIICQRPYRADNTGAAYVSDEDQAGEGTVALVTEDLAGPPTRSILPIEDDVLEQIAQSYVPLDAGRTFQLGSLRAAIPAGTVLYPWHQFALAIINTSIDERPVYFASSGNAATEVGMSPYLVRQGLAFKVHPLGLPEETAAEGMDPIPSSSPLISVTGRWVDTPRTAKLMDEVFVHRGELPNWAYWPDQSTIGIPNYYAWGYYALAQTALSAGENDVSNRYQTAAQLWSALGS